MSRRAKLTVGSNQYRSYHRSDIWNQMVNDMALDQDWSKRLRAAQQLGASAQVLHQLAGDPHGTVRGAVLANPGCDAECLTIMVYTDPSSLSQVVGHRQCPTQLVHEAAKSPHVKMRKYAAQHHNCAGDVLVVLLADPDPAVRQAAALNPNLPEQYRQLLKVSDRRRLSFGRYRRIVTVEPDDR